jgi:hypothetical protein
LSTLTLPPYKIGLSKIKIVEGRALTYGYQTIHVILCGHSACGGVTAATAAAPSGMAAVDNWLLPLKTLMNRHSKLLNAAPDKVKALVTLSVQHGIKLLKANNTIAKNPSVVVHGAIYDLTKGSLSFLGEAGNDSAIEPDPDFMSNPGEIIRVGNFATSEVRSAAQTNTFKVHTFAQPYSKPPRIVLGLTSLDVTIHNDNPRMMCTATNITTTSFQVNINTWGSSQINNASCTWLEIPDTPDYADYQTGLFSTSDDHPWNQVRSLTQRNITFTRPFTVPPTVVVWLTGFDTAQNAQMSLNATATDITTTGFTINLDSISGIPVYGQWTNWVAIPQASPFGLQTADFGVVGAITQSSTGTSTFDQRDLNATVAPAVTGAINQVVVGGPTAYRTSLTLGNVTGSTVDWTASTSGDAAMPICKGTYITIPGLIAASSAL